MPLCHTDPTPRLMPVLVGVLPRFSRTRVKFGGTIVASSQQLSLCLAPGHSDYSPSRLQYCRASAMWGVSMRSAHPGSASVWATQRPRAVCWAAWAFSATPPGLADRRRRHGRPGPARAGRR